MIEIFQKIYLPNIFDWVIDTSIMVSILVGFILCIKVILRNKLTARWHYALWLILIVRLILPWSRDSSFSIYSILSRGSEHPYSYMQKNTKVQLEKKINEPKAYTFIPQERNEREKGIVPPNTIENTWHISMYDIFLYVWLLGVVYLGSFIIIANKRLYIYIKKQPAITDEKVVSIFENCKEVMSIKQNISLLLAGKISNPTLLGFKKPRTLLCEKHMQKLDDNQLRYIFYHELAHVKLII
ncbi:hypothetical protein IG3_06239 [Bacillus cereus HuA2-1]|uniref:Peptidase M56 domain-containing protein n=1 Tax=Bacillus cereus HuA2-1 TaxID=1053201 RepID=J9BID0_BACCE|nr:M56 family metallopeptidase [Bacillus cereus]EJV73780.1 hypothetical protein IG3_06239 [Bacillus cereus HuA2-1]